MRVAVRIVLSGEERDRLERWLRSLGAPVRLRGRSRMVLMAADGTTNRAIAAEPELDRNWVGRRGRCRRSHAVEHAPDGEGARDAFRDGPDPVQ
ncbi:MAG: hypothetical protein OYK82_12750 [Gammaproteobacteria bacterium]|nr:hypothetical protein [Gammaproteobacteria bacterium]